MSYTRQPGWEFQRALVAPTKNRCNILAHPLHTCPLFGDGQVWQVWASMEVARSRVAGCGGIILPNLLIFVQLAHYLGLSTLSKLEDAPSPPAPPRRGEGSQNALLAVRTVGWSLVPPPTSGEGVRGRGPLARLVRGGGGPDLPRHRRAGHARGGGGGGAGGGRQRPVPAVGLGLVGARPVEQKKGADEGIDGRLYARDDNSGAAKQVILSVTGGHTDVTPCALPAWRPRPRAGADRRPQQHAGANRAGPARAAGWRRGVSRSTRPINPVVFNRLSRVQTLLIEHD